MNIAILVLFAFCFFVPQLPKNQTAPHPEELRFQEEQWEHTAVAAFKAAGSDTRTLLATAFFDGIIVEEQPGGEKILAINAQASGNPRIVLLLREIKDIPDVPSLSEITFKPSFSHGMEGRWTVYPRSLSGTIMPRPAEFFLQFKSLWRIPNRTVLVAAIALVSMLMDLPDGSINLSGYSPINLLLNLDINGTITKKTRGDTTSISLVVSSGETSGAVSPVAITVIENSTQIDIRIEDPATTPPRNLDISEAIKRVDALLDVLPASIPSVRNFFLAPWKGQGEWEVVTTQDELRAAINNAIRQ